MPDNTHEVSEHLGGLSISLDRDLFLRMLIRDLAGTLQQVVGAKEAAGFISVAGQQIGEYTHNQYLAALDKPILSWEEVPQVLVDLKRRIQGDFYVIEESDDRIVLGNRACPFGDKVIGRPTMCMMTSNVFGSIASRSLGYAKVELQQTIAEGHGECRVIVYLKTTPDSERADGREYFGPDVR